MKFIIVLALAMLVSFSMEAKLRSRSKSKQLDSKYINTPINIRSAHADYLYPKDKYNVRECDPDYHYCDKNERIWTIKPASNGDYKVVSSNGNCLCIRGDKSGLCSIEDPDSDLKLIIVNADRVGFQGKSGRYLRAGVFGGINTASKMDSWERWRLYNP